MGRPLLALVVSVGVAMPGLAQAAGITVLSGSFGTLGKNRQLDIVAKLRDLCGSTGNSCDIFCSETSFGRYDLGRRAICRVVYRCSDGATRSVEAAREEPIVLRCGDDDIDERPPTASAH